MSAVGSELDRLRTFWNSRYRDFGLSESGWFGAGDRLNHYIYKCKTRALQHALSALGIDRVAAFAVLDAGCGQGYFAAFYREQYPAVRYVGLDISERAIAHVGAAEPGAELHVANLCDWSDPTGRRFDVIQSLEVLHLILDDGLVKQAVASLSSQLSARGALLLTAAVPDETHQPSDYLRYRSRRFWTATLGALRLRIVRERPMYYWLPAGGPANRYARYALNRLGPRALYVTDRLGLAAHAPRPSPEPMDCRMRLLTIVPERHLNSELSTLNSGVASES